MWFVVLINEADTLIIKSNHVLDFDQWNNNKQWDKIMIIDIDQRKTPAIKIGVHYKQIYQCRVITLDQEEFEDTKGR